MHLRSLLLALAVGLSIAACSSSSDKTNDAPTVTVTTFSGAVSPSYQYQDEISIVGNTFTLTRSGGSLVVTGTWKKQLSAHDLTDLATLAAQCDASDTDTTLTAPPGSGASTLNVSGNVYHDGGDKVMATDPKKVLTLVRQLRDAFGLAPAYKGADAG
jgi:hypothetical protein